MREVIVQAIYWGVPMIGALVIAVSCLRDLFGLLR